MHGRKVIALAVGGLSAMAACSTVSVPERGGGAERTALPERAATVRPLMVVRDSAGVDSEGMYRIGRAFHGQRRHQDAVAAYRKALVLDPGHVEARNALAVAYAELGLAIDAEREFKAAIAQSPTLSHLRSNLGYHYLQAGRTDDAIAALREAVRLDPANSRALRNLASAEGGATPAVTLASSAGTHISTSVAAPQIDAVAETPRAPADPMANGVPQAARPVSIAELVGSTSMAPKAQLVSLAPNVWALRAHSTSEAVTPLPVRESVVVQRDKALPILGSPAIVRLEIANGNGITGLARRVGTYLETLGMPAPRLTNQRPFDQRRTQVLHIPGMEQAARDLLTTLGTPGEPVVAPRIDRNAQVRVVLGKDFNEIEAVARAPLRAWKQIASAPQGAGK